MRTLVLNAGYEPLAVVSFRRALVLVLAGKASILAEGQIPVAGVQQIFSRPTVILLNRYIHLPYSSASPVSRRAVLRRDSHHCGYCGKSAATVDHIQPKSRGGTESWQNLVACCLRCNNLKGNRTLQELGWKLRVTPQPPEGRKWRIRELEQPVADWGPYLHESAA